MIEAGNEFVLAEAVGTNSDRGAPVASEDRDAQILGVVFATRLEGRNNPWAAPARAMLLTIEILAVITDKTFIFGPIVDQSLSDIHETIFTSCHVSATMVIVDL